MKWAAVGLLALFGVSCGGSPAFTVDVDVATNQTENPFKELQQMSAAENLRGIYFRFEPMTCPMGSIHDPSSGAAVDNSDTRFQGSDVRTEYELDTTQLSPGVFYRVTMFALAPVGDTPTHKGVGDCPIKLSLGKNNRVTICFGDNDALNPPICPGLTPLNQCPGNPTTTCS